MVASAGRPLVLVPLAFSSRIKSQPAARNAATWIAVSCPLVLTRAYPIRGIRDSSSR